MHARRVAPARRDRARVARGIRSGLPALRHPSPARTLTFVTKCESNAEPPFEALDFCTCQAATWPAASSTSPPRSRRARVRDRAVRHAGRDGAAQRGRAQHPLCRSSRRRAPDLGDRVDDLELAATRCAPPAGTPRTNSEIPHRPGRDGACHADRPPGGDVRADAAAGRRPACRATATSDRGHQPCVSCSSACPDGRLAAHRCVRSAILGQLRCPIRPSVRRAVNLDPRCLRDPSRMVRVPQRGVLHRRGDRAATTACRPDRLPRRRRETGAAPLTSLDRCEEPKALGDEVCGGTGSRSDRAATHR